MTEDEAKKKWCPFAIATEENHGSYNRTGGNFIVKRDGTGQPIYRDPITGKEGTIAELNFGKSRHSLTAYEPVGEYSPAVPDRGCLCLASACMAWKWHSFNGKDGEPLGDCIRLFPPSDTFR